MRLIVAMIMAVSFEIGSSTITSGGSVNSRQFSEFFKGTHELKDKN